MGKNKNIETAEFSVPLKTNVECNICKYFSLKSKYIYNPFFDVYCCEHCDTWFKADEAPEDDDLY